MSETIEPLFDRVLVKRDKPPEKTSHGLISVSEDKSVIQRGVVAAAGPGDGDTKMAVAIGDIVMFGKFDGQEIKVNDEDGYLMLSQRELLAIIRTSEES